jgi:AcrR family transcriptional regulator
MAIEDRRRERAARRKLITATARTLAEREGWDAVTTRRLSAEIEYSQPVIYKHFLSLDDLVEAVALEGFEELADAIGHARRAAAPEDAVTEVARAYSAWAEHNPALYDAMFTRTTRLHFGAADVPMPLADGYAELRAATTTIAGERDVDTLTEVLWAALHGLVTLGRNARLRPNYHRDRIDLLIAQFRSHSSASDNRSSIKTPSARTE